MAINIPQSRLKPIAGSTGVSTPGSAAFGSTVGGANAQLGGTLTNIATDMQLRENETRVSEADASLQNSLRTIDSEFRTLKGKDAFDGYKEYERHINDAIKQAGRGLTNAAQRDMFQKVAGVKQNAYLTSGDKYRQGEFQRYNIEASQARLDASVQTYIAAQSAEAEGIARATMDASLEDLALDQGLPPESIAQLRSKLVTQAHAGRIANMIGDGSDLKALQAAHAYFRDNTSEIEPDKRDDIERQFKALRVHSNSRIASDLELNVRRGVGSRDAIDKAFDQGIISGAKRTQLQSMMDHQAKVAYGKLEVEEAASYGDQLDYKDKDHKAFVEARFAEIVTGSPDPNARRLAAVKFAKAGIIPAQVQRDIRVHARSGTPEQVAATAKIVQQIAEEAPQTLADLSTKDLALFDTVAEMQRAGVPVEQAVEVARGNTTRNDAERQALVDRYKQDIKDDGDNNLAALQDQLDSSDYDQSWFSGAPAASPAMQGEYDRLVAEFYQFNGGDLASARTLAFKSLQRTWAPTSINGDDQIMRYAPDKDTGIPADRLRESLADELKPLGVDSIDNVRIVSDNITARSQRGGRSYGVYTVDDNGLPEVVRGPNGLPIRWVPAAKDIVDTEDQEQTSLAIERRANDEREREKAKREYEARKGGK